MRVAATPLDFLVRAEAIFGGRVAVVEGDRRYTYAEFADRCRRAGGVLEGLGVRAGDRVAVLCRNSAMMLEAHYSVPAVGGVLVPLNHRLLPAELGRLLDHCGARLVLHDDEFAGVARELGLPALGRSAYEDAVREGSPVWREPHDEGDLLSINYTSGTTGRPKGVMYEHRGAYFQSLAMVAHARLGVGSRYLWTLPMFHCNGWCFTWAVTAAGATHVCLGTTEPGRIWDLIGDGVTHLNAAPTVLIGLAHHEAARPAGLRVATGGAPPSPALLARLAELDVEVTHLYGLTETYGPAMVCDWQPEWSHLPAADQARLKANQGNANVLGGRARVIADGADVPADGKSMGEVALRGNNVMRGYFRDPAATAEAIRDGWFFSGDLAVMHPDGYIELRDRAKDIIVSGGENIASIEVEQVLAAHPSVLEVAVVGVPDPRWGETPVAFVVPRSTVNPEELRTYARQHLAGFKVPTVFTLVEELPKTATGKVQKYLLRR